MSLFLISYINICLKIDKKLLGGTKELYKPKAGLYADPASPMKDLQYS